MSLGHEHRCDQLSGFSDETLQGAYVFGGPLTDLTMESEGGFL